MRRIIALGTVALLAGPASALAQPLERPTQPENLISVLPLLFGPEGLLVDSQSHRAHFNASFEDGFGPMNMALASQLTTVLVPPAITVGGYGFDSTGLFQQSQQSFGVILSERPELIGRGRLGLGFSVQHADFGSIDGMNLDEIHTVFTHDSPELGGIRYDVVASSNAIDVRQTQYIGFLSYGLTEWMDFSLAVPLVTVDLRAVSLATLHRFGSSADPTTHFFEEQTEPLGTRRLFSAAGQATGIGDITVRLKGLLPSSETTNLALGIDVRLPTGDEENLLGTGATGVRSFAAWSLIHMRVSPHASVSYQWNGSSALVGALTMSETGDLSDEVGYGVGAAVAISRHTNITIDVLGRYIPNSLRLQTEDFVAITGDRFSTLRFREASLHSTHAAIGITSSTSKGLQGYASLLFKLNDDGLRDTVIPVGGIQYGF